MQLARIVALLVIVAAVTAWLPGRAGATVFPDTAKHWAAGEIDVLARQGVLSGFPDGKFYPEKKVTRREMAKIIFSIFAAAGRIDTDRLETLPDYPDIHEGWGQQYLQLASMLLPAGTDGLFRPDSQATRRDVALLAFKAALLENDRYRLQDGKLMLEIPLPGAEAWRKLVEFKEYAGLPEQYRRSTAYLAEDPEKNDFYANAGYFFTGLAPVALLVDKGILRGYKDGGLGLDKTITRAETAVIAARLLQAGPIQANKFFLEPAGKVYHPRTIKLDQITAEKRLQQLGTFYRQEYKDPIQRGKKVYNYLIHCFQYDWQTREGLKQYTVTGIAGLMSTGRGTDDPLARYYAVLAEAAGLKAEVVQGKAINPGEAGKHTWVELLIDGRTVPVDPTYGVCTGDMYYNNFQHWSGQGYQWIK